MEGHFCSSGHHQLGLSMQWFTQVTVLLHFTMISTVSTIHIHRQQDLVYYTMVCESLFVLEKGKSSKRVVSAWA
jgi:hypothetical protein